jgi:hypothetical protein
MAKPNYSFEKRQRELARKKKQEEKRSRHAKPKSADDGSPADEPAAAPVAGTPDKPTVG